MGPIRLETTVHMQLSSFHVAAVSPLESSSLTMAIDPFYIWFLLLYIFLLASMGIIELPSPTAVLSETGLALNKLKPTFGPGTATVRIRVALDIPNRRDRQSLPSTLRRVVPGASPRVTLKRVLSTPFVETDQLVSKQWLAVVVASELLQSKSPIYAASGACFYHRNDQKAQIQFFEMSAEECQKHITFSEESVNKYETETMAVVSLIFSTTNPGWAAKAREICTLRERKSAYRLSCWPTCYRTDPTCCSYHCSEIW
jgi:hypothetical protein